MILNYVKPERLTTKKIHQNVQPIFNSKEQELQIDQIIINLQKLDSLTISDLETITIALFFHTESNDNMPTMECYKNLLLKSLQSKAF